MIEADNEQSICAPSHIRTGTQHYNSRRASLDLVCGAYACLNLPYTFIYQLAQKTASNAAKTNLIEYVFYEIIA